VAFDAYGSAVRGHGRFHLDVYVRDLGAHTTRLASRASGVRGARTNDNSSSEWPSISADGRLVVFQSDSTNLVSGDHNHSTDVFVRDLHAHTTALVSRARGVRTATGTGASVAPRISADGRSVAFDSDANNLVSGGRRNPALYVRSLRTHSITLVSRLSLDEDPAEIDGPTYVLSGNGDVVAFSSRALNLTADDADEISDVFVSDLRAQTTEVVSRASGADGPKGNADSEGVSISTDGRLVLFSSKATSLTPDDTNGGAFLRQLGPPG
jgi:Tol biopolymer transport system component